MLGQFVGPERQPEQNWFRYTVKCARDFNRKIEAAAKAAGVSPNEFVQAHFETILGGSPKGAGRTIDADPARLARKHEISVMAARAFIWLAGEANGARNVTASFRQIAAAAGSDDALTGRRLRDQLLESGLIEDIDRKACKAGSVYRIVEEPS